MSIAVTVQKISQFVLVSWIVQFLFKNLQESFQVSSLLCTGPLVSGLMETTKQVFIDRTHDALHIALNEQASVHVE